MGFERAVAVQTRHWQQVEHHGGHLKKSEIGHGGPEHDVLAIGEKSCRPED
ncbi:Uncharacterised protein [Mycobacteroides abscessus subsp. abscessus]|nr:Uncharacterised protein [Mycobacteroides abscessus subsp. abscessus]